ncbi:MAG: TRAP transporter permease [Sphingomonadaceae bacterium]
MTTPAAGRRPWGRSIFALQALLIALVVGWVLDVPGKLGIALYTEQFLITVIGLAVALAFLSVPARSPRAGWKTRVPWWDALAAAAGLAICLYIAWRYPVLVNTLTELPTDGILMSAALVLLVLEATRRTTGMTLVAITLVGVVYAMLGDHLPGVFQSRPVEFRRLLVYLGMDTNALLGAPVHIGITVVIPFILMGQILARCGGSEFFTDLARAWMGRYRGGAAKIAVVGSALFGMISGSAVANVSAVGVVSIPLMKRSGFPPTLAAAVEAVGSTGGQLMPPVMGAAAFLMAEVLQVPYSAVMIAAIIPALLYYLALFFQVDLEAAKRGIVGEPRERLPRAREVLRAGWYFPIPFGVLLYALLVMNTRAEYAALLAAGVLIACALAFGFRGHRYTVSEVLRAVVSTGGGVIDLVLICAAAGMFIGILNITGFAFGLTLQLLTITQHNVGLLLVLTALMGVLLGMGLPTVGVYVIMATLVAPALVQAGILPLAAHMFVLYFGIMSMVTPPVALAAFAAANIGGTDPNRTGWTAARIGWSAYIVPFLFVFSPTLLMKGAPLLIAWNGLTAALGIWMGTIGVVGFFLERIGVAARALFVVAGVLLLIPGDSLRGAHYTDYVGLALGALLLWREVARHRQQARA